MVSGDGNIIVLHGNFLLNWAHISVPENPSPWRRWTCNAQWTMGRFLFLVVRYSFHPASVSLILFLSFACIFVYYFILFFESYFPSLFLLTSFSVYFYLLSLFSPLILLLYILPFLYLFILFFQYFFISLFSFLFLTFYSILSIMKTLSFSFPHILFHSINHEDSFLFFSSHFIPFYQPWETLSFPFPHILFHSINHERLFPFLFLTSCSILSIMRDTVLKFADGKVYANFPCETTCYVRPKCHSSDSYNCSEIT
jgi:hypothetical protein